MQMITEHLKFADIFPDKVTEFSNRLNLKVDDIPFIRKYYTAEKARSEVKSSERAVISYITTGIKDRDSELLESSGVKLENYRKNPVVLFGHDYRSIPPAKNIWIKQDEKGLIAKTVYAKNPQADELYRAYTEDVGGTGPLLNAWSVGFVPIEWKDTKDWQLRRDPSLPKRTFTSWEILEYSMVPVPSNPAALTIAIEKNLISMELQKEFNIEQVQSSPAPVFDPDVFAEALKKAMNPEKIKEAVREGAKLGLEKLREKVITVEKEDRLVEVDVAKVEKAVFENLLEWAMENNPELAKRMIDKKIKTDLEIQLGRMTGKVF